MYKILINLFVFLFCLSMNAQEGKLKRMYVADAKTACQFNNTITSCYKVKTHPDSNWSAFPYQIENFNYEPGVETYIVVEETPILFAEENGPKFTYKLSSIIDSKITILSNRLILANNKWRLINLELERKITPSRKSKAFLNFSIDSNFISGFGGCNGFTGNAMIEDGIIQFGLISNTLISCVNDEIESMLMEGLKGKAAYYVRNNMLFVVCENHLIIHLRPEIKLDSVIAKLYSPLANAVENSISEQKNGMFIVMLEEIKESSLKPMQFSKVELSEIEKQSMYMKLKNLDAENSILEVQLLITANDIKGFYQALVLMKDGSKKSLIIKYDN